MADDVIKLIMERNELNDFLSVPAPDVLHKNAFWHNKDGKPIDYNIYHPKYGYPGFETTTKDHVIASFNPVTVYQDARTGKYIHCRYYLQMLCTADGKNFTNKVGEKVIMVDYLQTHLKRLAEDEQDFKLIYQREFVSKKLTDTPDIRTNFCKELINHIHELIGLHEKRSSYKEGRDIKILALANRFIDYIKPLPSQQTETKSEQPKAPVIALFCNLVNESKLIEKGETESVENYCKRICESYKFFFTDRIRQGFFNSNNKENIKKIKEIILPKIDEAGSKKINEYLNRNEPPKQKLYA
jgi:hypothetical protein